jgi:predicted ATPase
MKNSKKRKKTDFPARERGITEITVCGYKSIHEKQRVQIRPLTILAGANSSGKSSIMQPLLLLKQTLEVTYDPGPLLLDGPNVKFTSTDQFLPRITSAESKHAFSIGISLGNNTHLCTYFTKSIKKPLEIEKMTYDEDQETTSFYVGMSHDEIMKIIPRHFKELYMTIRKEEGGKPRWTVLRDRCFLDLAIKAKPEKIKGPMFRGFSPSGNFESYIRGLIHLPGLRGNPSRNYPVTAVGSSFPGTFEKYVASVVAQWQLENPKKLNELNADLEFMGLTWKVHATSINETQVELQVGRLTHPVRGGARDMVNIADVGYGLSQYLPVLVSLHTAKPGQLVYLEQPEIHLHPRAQSAMAKILANAISRGVRVVVETHSSLLLLAIQATVAEGKLDPSKVKLHWFKRNGNGTTEISSGDLGKDGSFGNWPEDFADVTLELERRYLDAAEGKGKR